MNSLRDALSNLKDDSNLGDMVSRAVKKVEAEQIKNDKDRAARQARKAYESNILSMLDSGKSLDYRGNFGPGTKVFYNGAAAKVLGPVECKLGVISLAIKLDEPKQTGGFCTHLDIAEEWQLARCSCRGYLPGHAKCSPRRRQQYRMRETKGENNENS